MAQGTLKHNVTLHVSGTRKARARAIAALNEMPQRSRMMYATKHFDDGSHFARIDVTFTIVEHWRPYRLAYVEIAPC